MTQVHLVPQEQVDRLHEQIQMLRDDNRRRAFDAAMEMRLRADAFPGEHSPQGVIKVAAVFEAYLNGETV